MINTNKMKKNRLNRMSINAKRIFLPLLVALMIVSSMDVFAQRQEVRFWIEVNVPDFPVSGSYALVKITNTDFNFSYYSCVSPPTDFWYESGGEVTVSTYPDEAYVIYKASEYYTGTITAVVLVYTNAGVLYATSSASVTGSWSLNELAEIDVDDGWNVVY